MAAPSFRRRRIRALALPPVPEGVFSVETHLQVLPSAFPTPHVVIGLATTQKVMLIVSISNTRNYMLICRLPCSIAVEKKRKYRRA